MKKTPNSKNKKIKMLYIVGRHKKSLKTGKIWTLMGVFDKVVDAAAQCKTTKDFILPVGVGYLLPKANIHAVFPKVEHPLIRRISRDALL